MKRINDLLNRHCDQARCYRTVQIRRPQRGVPARRWPATQEYRWRCEHAE